MFKFVRIICILICWISCLYESMQLSTVAAVPYEYFEDHEQLSYDMDTEQSKAKYDTRLLSEQLLKEQNSGERNYNDRQDDYAEDEDDLQPHERAASCHTNGHKYTHGQKVPREDPCEVCLCMDGEIFCWWEKCAKKRQKISTTKQSSLAAAEMFTSKTEQISQATITTTEQSLQQQQKRKMQFSRDEKFMQSAQKQLEMKNYKKKIFKQQQKNEQQLIKQHKQQLQQHQQQQQQLQQQHEQHQQQAKQPHMYTHTGSSSKILNFPENLPSVLYHDYKTEEHQHHQHQHHQQHLKHQQQLYQKLLQKQQQQQQQAEQQKQQQEQPHQDQQQHSAFSSDYKTATPSATTTSKTTTARLLATILPPYLSTNTDNLNEETETDSDILPEPPTKKPKMTAASAATTTTATATAMTTATATTATAAGLTTTTPNLALSTTDRAADKHAAIGAHVRSQTDNDDTSDSNACGNCMQLSDAAEPFKASSGATADSAEGAPDTPSARLPLELSSLYNNTNNRLKVETKSVYNFNNSSEEEQDNAFHRWLTSTETNSKNYNGSNGASGDTNFETTQQNVDSENRTGWENTTTNNDYNNNNNNINNDNENDKVLYTQDLIQQRAQNAGSAAFFRSSYNDYSNEYNGSVVNIDIMLTAGDEQQLQQHQYQQHHQKPKQKQRQHKHQPHQQLQPNEEQTAEASSIILQHDDLISNSSKAKTAPNPAAQTAGPLDNDNGSSRPQTLAPPTPAALLVDKFSSAALIAAPETATTLSPDRQCNVMGTLYKIGDVLPQDTGNCLQCVCIEGSTSDDTPRVTCSPHNCPPLVLPDLFDATGY